MNLENPHGETPPKHAAKKSAPSHDADEDDLLETDDEDFAPQTTTATPLGRILIAAQAELEAIAESGITARRDRELLTGAARRLEAVGLNTCSRPITRLLELLAGSARLAEPACRNEAAGVLLHSYYLLRLASDQETLAAACTGLRPSGS